MFRQNDKNKSYFLNPLECWLQWVFELGIFLMRCFYISRAGDKIVGTGTCNIEYSVFCSIVICKKAVYN